MSTSIPLGAPIWADAASADLEQDLEFYRRLFGWTAQDSGDDFGHYHLLFKDGRSVMGLGPTWPGQEPSRTWNIHFRVADCDQATVLAEQLGATVLMQPMNIYEDLRFSMVADPAGAPFYLIATDRDDATTFQAYGEDFAVFWIEYHTAGVPAEAMRFYADLLGWEVRADAPSQDDPHPFALLRPAGLDTDLGGCQAEELGPDDSAHWQVLVKVPDADACCAKAVEVGGAVMAGPFDVDGRRIAAIATPTGAAITIGQDK